MKFELQDILQPDDIYNSRNLLMKFETQGYEQCVHIYNSRNLLMKFELQKTFEDEPSTTVEIY